MTQTTNDTHAAKVVNFASQIDPGTIEQATQTAALPFVYPHVALMPDAHVGKGAAVGTVIPTLGDPNATMKFEGSATSSGMRSPRSSNPR